jgi:polysaccharide biosynthesis protein PelG
MAGIGFELRKLLAHGSLLSQLQAYAFAGVISSGPWVLSILGVLLIGLLSTRSGVPSQAVAGFQVSVTYLMAASLILTGPLQLVVARFSSDRLFEKRHDLILPNLMGAIAIVTLAAGLVGIAVSPLFAEESLLYRLLMVASFVTIANIWVVTVLLSATREWKWILASFFVGYCLTVGGALIARPFGVNGLLMGFLVGHSVLLFMLLAHVLRSYPARQIVAFGFLRREQTYPSLAVTGAVYNAAIWAANLMFWFNPFTSEPVIGPLRVSPVYDLPIFLAYLSIVPGMAVFLVHMETDFAEQNEAFYEAVRGGATLDTLLRIKDRLVYVARHGIYEILKVQGLTIVTLIAFGDQVLAFFGIPGLHRLLFNVDLVAVGMQMLLLAILNMLFYFDQRRTVLGLSLLFLGSNIALTGLTQYLGPIYYGYGFALSVLLTSIVGLGILSKKLDRLEYETFMLQTARL